MFNHQPGFYCVPDIVESELWVNLSQFLSDIKALFNVGNLLFIAKYVKKRGRTPI